MKKRILKILLLLFVAGISFTVPPEVIPEIKEIVPILKNDHKEKVPVKVLKTYAGTYVFNETVKAKVTLKEDNLFVIQEELVKEPLVELEPVSKTKFKVKELEAEIEFKVNEEKNSIVLTYIRYGQEMTAYKID